MHPRYTAPSTDRLRLQGASGMTPGSSTGHAATASRARLAPRLRENLVAQEKSTGVPAMASQCFQDHVHHFWRPRRRLCPVDLLGLNGQAFVIHLAFLKLPLELIYEHLLRARRRGRTVVVSSPSFGHVDPLRRPLTTRAMCWSRRREVLMFLPDLALHSQDWAMFPAGCSSPARWVFQTDDRTRPSYTDQSM